MGGLESHPCLQQKNKRRRKLSKLLLPGISILCIACIIDVLLPTIYIHSKSNSFALCTILLFLVLLLLEHGHAL